MLKHAPNRHNRSRMPAITTDDQTLFLIKASAIESKFAALGSFISKLSFIL
jgi:hypothetical protein